MILDKNDFFFVLIPIQHGFDFILSWILSAWVLTINHVQYEMHNSLVGIYKCYRWFTENFNCRSTFQCKTILFIFN